MTLIKTSLLNGVAVVIRLLTLLGINKILAIYVGPAGYAALGQFQNAVQMITTFASGAISTGVTKYTAEYYEDEQKQRMVWRTAGTIAFTGSMIASLLVIFFSKSLARLFLNDESYSGIFIWFGITLVLFVFNTLLLAILNGKKDIHRFVVANIAGSLFALLVTSLLSIQYGLYGALIALAVYQSLSFFITLYLCSKVNWFRLGYFFGRIDKETVKNLGKFTAMALTSAACIPVSHMLIRNHVGETLGWDAAGHWEAMWRLSSAYLMLVTTTLSVYYLPKLSELKDSTAIKNEIINGYKIIFPVAAVCGLSIYLARDFIIRILFSAEFAGMETLFAWQMVGDTLKIGSWILAYVLTAKALFKTFIVSEIMYSLVFLGLVYYLTDFFGIESLSIAHTLSYVFYFAFIFIALKLKKII